jgi:hypothetical protein
VAELVKKREFVGRVIRAREAWDAAIAGFEQDEMVMPSFCGDWSVKDVIAHIGWYDREMVKMLEAKKFGDSRLWRMSLDERNAVIFRENKGRMPEEVLEEQSRVFATLIGLLVVMTEDDLNEPTHFPGMPLEWRPWQVIASNTYEHYEAHLCQARRWREESSAPRA